MYNNLMIFDLDGVLINSRELHYEALNEALRRVNPIYMISKEEHLSTYDGLPTNKKLDLLTKKKGLPIQYHKFVWQEKQSATLELLDKLTPSTKITEIFSYVKHNKGYKIAIASNSVTDTVLKVVERLELKDYVDIIQSNETVIKPKPYPEMYWNCMMMLNAIPATTIIIEDSHIGRQGAIDSGARLLPVEDEHDLTLDKVAAMIDNHQTNKRASIAWRDSKLNVLIPMAGKGSRFAQAGYTFPKPLIDVKGKPMIQAVVDNLNIWANYIFIAQQEHTKEYNLETLLKLITPSDCSTNLIQIDGITEGAACTVLKAKELIDNDNPLIIANSDQLIEWNSNEVMYAFSADNIDAGILTFKSVHPKWSYAKLDDNGFVSEVAEKNPISDNATVGIYYWKRGSDFVKYAEQMIAKNIRVNNEFYVAPVFNEAIADGKKIRIKEIEKMWGIGTPEDLSAYLMEHNNE